jgi:hypothetical protein
LEQHCTYSLHNEYIIIWTIYYQSKHICMTTNREQKFHDNQSLFFFLNDGCLVEKQQVPIVSSLVRLDPVSNPRFNVLEVSTLTICTPLYPNKHKSLFVSLSFFFWLLLFCLPFFNLQLLITTLVGIFRQTFLTRCSINLIGTVGTELPPFFNFLFTYLFSITFLYYFIFFS